MGNRSNDNCYIDLANAIVKQACDDYMFANRRLIKAQIKKANLQDDLATEIDLMEVNNEIIRQQATINSCVTFFQSEYAQLLSDADLMYVKRRMDEKIEKEVKK
jgi:hypothetical protein